MKTESTFGLASKTHARVLFWVSVGMCVMALSAIGVAELFMPENVHGQKGVLTFYRWFGACLVIESAVATWAYHQLKRFA
jgi:hypothetical protein